MQNHVDIGRRIQVVGNSCSGKSTTAERLASVLSIPFIDLDALNWLPGWVALTETNIGEFERRVGEATSCDAWAVAGEYGRVSRKIFWPRVETIIWLDMPLHRLIFRVIDRSWRRARSKELLWGTNVERFWPHLKIWNKHDSLLAWIITQHRRKRRRMFETMQDPNWSHIQFIRLDSGAGVDRFVEEVQSGALSRLRKADIE